MSEQTKLSMDVSWDLNGVMKVILRFINACDIFDFDYYGIFFASLFNGIAYGPPIIEEKTPITYC